MTRLNLKHLRIDRAAGDIVTVWIEVAGRSVNLFDNEVLQEIEDVISDFECDPAASVVLFRSARSSGFMAGADVRLIADLKTPDEALIATRRGQRLFDRIERLGVPTVAIIHGPCLGGGLEFALACRYRIALERSTTVMGLPEIQLGLIPAWGGTQRLPRLIGVRDALPMILQGRKLTARQALRAGLVDAIADQPQWESTILAFADACAGRASVAASRRRTGGGLIRRLLNHTRAGRALVFRSAEKRVSADSVNYPALPAAIRAVRAAFAPGEQGFETERKEFVTLLTTPTCRNLLEMFFRRERARSMTHSLYGQTAVPAARRIAVLGGGTMGAGIGLLAALRHHDVVLKELSPELSEGARRRIMKQLDDLVADGRLSQSERLEAAGRLRFTDTWDAVIAADLVIEAVVEDADVKKRLFGELDTVLKSESIIATNTSALSVTAMSQATNRPDRVAGLHFFNPVHRMDLVEVIHTRETSEQTMSTLLQFVGRLGKTPIIARDAPGFVVNRILFPYLAEAVRMIIEGRSPDELDRAMRAFGMPMGPIELMDLVGIDVVAHVAEQLSGATEDSAAVLLLLRQLCDMGWLGRKSGCGFYRYRHGRPHRNPTLPAALNGMRIVPRATTERTTSAMLDDGLTDVQRRLIFPMLSEAAACLQDDVVKEPWTVDLAMVLGAGFAPFRGGPVALAETIGDTVLKNNFAVLEQRHGRRFQRAFAPVGLRTSGPADQRTGSHRTARHQT